MTYRQHVLYDINLEIFWTYGGVLQLDSLYGIISWVIYGFLSRGGGGWERETRQYLFIVHDTHDMKLNPMSLITWRYSVDVKNALNYK